MVSGSTCGSLGHSHHRRGADRHSQRCHRSGRTCIQYIASGMSSQRLTVPQKTACKRDVLGRGRKDIHHTTHIVSESWVKAWEKKVLSLSFPPTRSPTVSAGHHFLWLARLLVPRAVPQTEVTVWVGLGQLLPLQVGRRRENHWNLLLQ